MTNTVHVNVGGTWKTATNYYVNVGGTWKTGSAIGPNISSAWKGFITSLVSTNLKLHLDAGDSDSYIGSGATWIDLITGNTARSVEFDGSDDVLTTASSSDFDFGSGAFTVEAWIYPESSSSSNLSVVSIWNYNDGKRSWSISGTGESSTIRGMVSPDGEWNSRKEVEGSVNQNEWNHVAFTRSSNTIYLFINGSLAESETFTGSVYNNTSDGIMVGGQGATDDINNVFDGKISNVRVVKGTAVYTSAFTPSIDPLTNITNTKLLCCNKSTTTGSTVTPGTITAHSSPTVSISNPFGNKRSVSFDGTDDYLTFSASSDLQLSTGDFTVEGWFKYDSASGYPCLFDCRSTTGSTTNGFAAFINETSGKLGLYTAGGWICDEGVALSADQWYHFAAVKNSGTIKLYINGVQSGDSYTTSTDFTNNTLRIGSGATGANNMNGLISNFRVVKGTAVYTSAFSAPTETLTNITNTKLLCCNNSSVIGGTVLPNTPTTNGDPTASVINPFGTDATISGATYSSSDGGILDFDGTDDYAVTEHSSDFDFGSGDFTVEVWCKPTNSSQVDPAIIALWNYPDGRRSWTIFGNTGGTAGTFDGSVRAAVSPDGAFATRTEITGTLTLNSWNHVVFTRISNTLTFYINNSSAGTASYTGSVYSNTVDGMTIGAMGDSAASVNEFDGGISQVRIYKGTGLTSTQVTENYNATKSTFGL
tara:strand:- start:1072 stop:3189 length:2118 start_codon:yes stop_codon:yes gene_type:complete